MNRGILDKKHSRDQGVRNPAVRGTLNSPPKAVNLGLFGVRYRRFFLAAKAREETRSGRRRQKSTKFVKIGGKYEEKNFDRR